MFCLPQKTVKDFKNVHVLFCEIYVHVLFVRFKSLNFIKFYHPNMTIAVYHGRKPKSNNNNLSNFT